MPTGTARFHRVLRAPTEHVYRAFLEPDAVVKWLPPFGFTCAIEHMDVRIGGTFRMAFINFRKGKREAFGGTYVELEPGKHIRYTDAFDDPNLPGTITTTIDLVPVMCGTEVHILQEGIPKVIPVEFCYLGWQESLLQLAQLVEADIPG